MTMSLKKTPMPEQSPEERSKNFLEVSLGYTEEMAVSEAARCLQCKHKPCVSGCPVNVHIPDFIAAIAKGEFEKAYQVLSTTNSLPAVCGRVCPQESQCESHCVRGIKGEAVAIGRLERFAADWHRTHSTDVPSQPASNGKQVAIIGSGPSGLACAGDLTKLGYKVTIFEAMHKPGGVLVYGIPEFRLPKTIVSEEIQKLQKMGVTIETNMVIGKVLSIEELQEMGFSAIFIGSGAGLPSFLGIPGESFAGVYSANEFLTRVNLMKGYDSNYDTPVPIAKHTIVIGGGNVAMDAARCAKRLGSDVTIVYRRSEEEMPARVEEVFHAKQEGIHFHFLTNPVRILGEKGIATKLVCQPMTLGEEDSSGRRRPIPVEGENFEIEADSIIIAIGTSPNPLLHDTTKGLTLNKRGCLLVNEETLETSLTGIYAGGDAVTGAATVILAMGAGKKAAASIHQYLTQSL